MARNSGVVIRATGLLISALLFLMAVLLVYAGTLRDPRLLSWNSWAYSELLINYDGGFVRRGLLGELIKYLSGGQSAIPVANAIVFFNFLFYSTAMTVLTVVSRKRSILNTILVFLMPGSVFAMSIGNEFFFRKEMLFFNALCIAGILFSISQSIAHRGIRRFAASGTIVLIYVFGIVLPFIHESFVFLSMPANVFLIRAAAREATFGACTEASGIKIRKALVYSYVGIGIAIFLLLSYFKGNGQVAQAIWDNLSHPDKTLFNGNINDSGGIIVLSWGLLYGLTQSMKVLVSGVLGYWIAAAMASVLYSLTLVSIDIGEHADAKEGELCRWLLCYVTLLACTLPMFVLGWDWGRWLVSTTISFAILYFAIDRMVFPINRLKQYGVWLSSASVKYQLLVGRNKMVFVAMLLMIAFTFKIPECCIGGGRWVQDELKANFRTYVHDVFHY